MITQRDKLNLLGGLIDWFKEYGNPSRPILYLDVRELHLLHVHIYLFCIIVSEDVFFLYCIWSYWIKFILNISIWPIDGMLKGTITLHQSGAGCNCNWRVLLIPQISKTGTTPSETVCCHTQDTEFTWIFEKNKHR